MLLGGDSAIVIKLFHQIGPFWLIVFLANVRDGAKASLAVVGLVGDFIDRRWHLGSFRAWFVEFFAIHRFHHLSVTLLHLWLQTIKIILLRGPFKGIYIVAIRGILVLTAVHCRSRIVVLVLVFPVVVHIKFTPLATRFDIYCVDVKLFLLVCHFFFFK